MKINNNSKYVLYIILFIIFILIRINYVLLSGEIENFGLKSLGISTNYFGILKNTILYDTFLPTYYLIIGILRNEILIKILNTAIAFANIFTFFIIGKKLLNEKLGLFLALFLTLNHFFLYYSSLIAPYCLIFLIQTLTINALIDYLKKPTKKHFKTLNIFNFILILCDSFGVVYVLSEIFILHLLGKRKKIYSKLNPKLINFSFIAFLITFPTILLQYNIQSKLVIPNTMNGVGLNFNSLYLMLSEYITPYLSFYAPESQTNSTLGLIYSFLLNPDIKNINSLKILITLFYSTILPIAIAIFFTIKVCLKNYRLKLLWLISALNLGIILILMLFEKIETQPIYTIQFFITTLVILGYGIFSVKDKLIKAILIVCLVAIQIISPELNSFNITIHKNYATLSPIKNFIKEYNITKEDMLFIPNNGKLNSLYFKKQSVFNYDDKYLQISKKNSILRNITNKKTKKITKKNIHFLMKNYLTENKINNYLMKYFMENIFIKEQAPKRYILVIDKLNSRPISQNSIIKFANQQDYNPHLRKINFNETGINQNQTKNLFNALKSKTLYNFANILNIHLELETIAEYKKLENEYYKMPSSDNIYNAISSYESDYVFIIFK